MYVYIYIDYTILSRLYKRVTSINIFVELKYVHEHIPFQKSFMFRMRRSKMFMFALIPVALGQVSRLKGEMTNFV